MIAIQYYITFMHTDVLFLQFPYGSLILKMMLRDFRCRSTPPEPKTPPGTIPGTGDPDGISDEKRPVEDEVEEDDCELPESVGGPVGFVAELLEVKLESELVAEEGGAEGLSLGDSEGDSEGLSVGLFVGDSEGTLVGDGVGRVDGVELGNLDGLNDGLWLTEVV